MRTMKSIVILAMAANMGCGGELPASIAKRLSEGKVVVEVLDDDTGKPIEAAKVTIGFQPYPGYNKWNVSGLTDSKGLFVASNKTYIDVWVDANKSGYYESSGGVTFKSRSVLLNRWEPYPAKVVVKLRKKRNPVPMYAMRVNWVKVPVIGKPVGFDLEKGDWVKPYGKGLVADFVFTFHRRYKAYLDFSVSLELEFSNKLDGLLVYDGEKKYFHSDYKWPYEAPLSGYDIKRLKKFNKIIPYEDEFYGKMEKVENNFRKEIKYIFRVRTKTNEKDEITSACHGKLIGDFICERDGTLSFTYCFNPDPRSRSLEFDVERNLFNFTEDEWEKDVKEP